MQYSHNTVVALIVKYALGIGMLDTKDGIEITDNFVKEHLGNNSHNIEEMKYQGSYNKMDLRLQGIYGEEDLVGKLLSAPLINDYHSVIVNGKILVMSKYHAIAIDAIINEKIVYSRLNLFTRIGINDEIPSHIPKEIGSVVMIILITSNEYSRDLFDKLVAAKLYIP